MTNTSTSHWSIYEGTVPGDRMVVLSNGQQTVDVRDSKVKSGLLALQSAGCIIRFCKLLILAI